MKILLTALLLLISSQSYALLGNNYVTIGGTCNLPGTVKISIDSTITYCDGTNWVPATLQCNNGTKGRIRGDLGILETCNGTNWVATNIPTTPAEDPYGNGDTPVGELPCGGYNLDTVSQIKRSKSTKTAVPAGMFFVDSVVCSAGGRGADGIAYNAEYYDSAGNDNERAYTDFGSGWNTVKSGYDGQHGPIARSCSGCSHGGGTKVIDQVGTAGTAGAGGVGPCITAPWSGELVCAGNGGAPSSPVLMGGGSGYCRLVINTPVTPGDTVTCKPGRSHVKAFDVVDPQEGKVGSIRYSFH